MAFRMPDLLGFLHDGDGEDGGDSQNDRDHHEYLDHYRGDALALEAA
jgi:hypothetical protein